MSSASIDEIASKAFDISWNENKERFVIVEKYESIQKIGIDSVQNENVRYIRFLNKDGEPHRNNGNPSFISADTVMWHKNGKLHRINKPAIVRFSSKQKYTWESNHMFQTEGTGRFIEDFPKEEYFLQGIRHRDGDLPAVIFNNKNEHKYWFSEGVLHREENKPAIINGNFSYFYKQGVLIKSKVDYKNIVANYIVENPVKIALILFTISCFMIFCFS